MTQERIKEVIALHQDWLNDKVDGVRADLTGAFLSGAFLSGADLRGADLRGADLRGVRLEGIKGDGTYIKSLQIEKYPISYTPSMLQIGCKNHLISEWVEFDDKKISQMDSGALEWWKKWKSTIMQTIERDPCEPTRS